MYVKFLKDAKSFIDILRTGQFTVFQPKKCAAGYLHLKQPYCTPTFVDNDDVSLNLVNRNPRSMELLRIARKPLGYTLDLPKKTYWYKLCFEKSQRNISAWVEHNNGKKLVVSSTKEWAIAKHLYSNIDASAAQNIGRVLARRCHQAGIYEVYTELDQLENSSLKISLFLAAMREEGIVLEEAPQIREKETYPNVNQMPCFPWNVTEEEVCKIDEHKLSRSDDDYLIR